MSDLDDRIDRLYQVDLGAFVAERNALAKSAKNADVKTLVKPSVPAWAVNQLYWRHRVLYGRLVQRAEAVREQHRRLLANEPADVRTAEAAHREALRDALDAAREVLTAAGHPLTPATLESVSRTLEALPSPDANGRLVKPLAPTGFEALSGLSIGGGRGRAPLHVVARAPVPAAPSKHATAEQRDDAARERARARAEREAAEREEAARRKKAQAALDQAQAAYDEAVAAVEAAERQLDAHRRDRDRAAATLKLAKRALG